MVTWSRVFPNHAMFSPSSAMQTNYSLIEFNQYKFFFIHITNKDCRHFIVLFLCITHYIVWVPSVIGEYPVVMDLYGWFIFGFCLIYKASRVIGEYKVECTILTAYWWVLDYLSRIEWWIVMESLLFNLDLCLSLCFYCRNPWFPVMGPLAWIDRSYLFIYGL